jgi:hypothetical protein
VKSLVEVLNDGQKQVKEEAGFKPDKNEYFEPVSNAVA